MKKGFAYAALCALTLAAPAAAETIYVPVLGTAAAAGGGLATKVWVDGVERQVAAGRTGLITIEAESFASVRAQLAGRNGAAELEAFTAEEAYGAGVDAQLGGLPQPRAIAALSVGAANLSERTAFCKATLSARNGNRLGEIEFEVEPMSMVQKNALAEARGGRVGGVNVSCDQSFYPLAVASQASGAPPIIAKAIGPNGPCTLWLTLNKQVTGHYTAASVPDVFHEATKANPKGIVCLKAAQSLQIAKAVFEWDTTLGPWSSRDRSGVHNLAYFFLDRYRSGVVGNVNALGPNKNQLKFMQNVGMTQGTNTNAKAGYGMQTGLTYHQIYTFDAANKTATLRVLLNGVQVSSFTAPVKPGNNQTLIVKPFGTGNLTGLAMTAEFGNYLGQHHPEEATVGWKYGRFKVDLTPK